MLAQKTWPTESRASAFNRMRQRTARRKNEQQLNAPAATTKPHRAPAMVRQTPLQSTPRSE